MIELKEIFEIPAALYNIDSARNIGEIFDCPTLLHLEGRRKERVFVSVLLHGNEDTGLFAIQRILQKYRNQVLPRSLTIFFGNIAAAQQGQRRLDGQNDYNRVWPSTQIAECDESRLMAKVTEIMRKMGVYASIDIHNNTGKNPHYGCVNVKDYQSLQLARLFSNVIVFFENPKGVQSMAFSKFCPAVAIECGKPGVEKGFAHAFEFVDAVLHSHEIPNHPLLAHEAGVYQTIARVMIAENHSLSFTADNADILLSPDLDKYNFSDLETGTLLAHSNKNGARLLAYNEDGKEIGDQYFELKGNEIRAKCEIMPAMLTLDERIIRLDCLCYLMEKIEV